MQRKLEIRYNADYERYELWEVFYDPKDKLYPILYENFWDFDKEKWVMELIAKRKFPDLYHKFL